MQYILYRVRKVIKSNSRRKVHVVDARAIIRTIRESGASGRVGEKKIGWVPEDPSRTHSASGILVLLSADQPFIHPHLSPAIMSSRTVWRSLQLQARRRFIVPETPYRCFSCTRRAQESPKSNQDDRMTHFGFQNVPEAQKESLGRFIGDILHLDD